MEKCVINKCIMFDKISSNQNNCRSYMDIRKCAKIFQFDVIFNEIKNMFEGDVGHWFLKGIIDDPKGVKQSCDSDLFAFEYIDQKAATDAGDDFSGSVYLPYLGKYIEVGFNS